MNFGCEDLLNRVKARIKASEPTMDDDDEKLYKKALQAEKYDFMRKQIRTVFNVEFQQTGKLPFDVKEAAELMDRAYHITAAKPPYILLTINTRPDVTIDVFKKTVEKFISKKTNLKYFGVYELRHSDVENLGLHAHILVHYSQTPYGFKRGTKNTFKHVCNIDDTRILNFKFITEDLIESKIDYMKGDKQKSKLDKVEADKIWRKENGLPEFFESRSPFPCRPAQISE